MSAATTSASQRCPIRGCCRQSGEKHNLPEGVTRAEGTKPSGVEPTVISSAIRQPHTNIRKRHERAYPADANSRFRNGFNATSARMAAPKSSVAATMKTIFQLPVPTGSKFANGTTSAAVPLAV